MRCLDDSDCDDRWLFFTLSLVKGGFFVCDKSRVFVYRGDISIVRGHCFIFWTENWTSGFLYPFNLWVELYGFLCEKNTQIFGSSARKVYMREDFIPTKCRDFLLFNILRKNRLYKKYKNKYFKNISWTDKICLKLTKTT